MRAQGSVELLIILSGVMLALLVIISTAYAQLYSFQGRMGAGWAQAGVNELADAAARVYSSGPGSSARVFLEVPDNVEPGRVFVREHVINIGVKTSAGTRDINARTSAPVEGALPTQPGGSWINVVAYEGKVVISPESA